ncbi:hypothetical protein C8R43DRAFT_1152460 [Mycena crocata]|nr:hypothetical protein C8R43DRAFT_1152460 [Mycena crocata]
MSQDAGVPWALQPRWELYPPAPLWICKLRGHLTNAHRDQAFPSTHPSDKYRGCFPYRKFNTTMENKTFDAFVPSNMVDLFALGKFKPDYVPYDTLRAVPLDAEHLAPYQYSKKITPKFGFTHAPRCYYFALAFLFSSFPSGTPGVPPISFVELNRRLFHTAILHDLGWTATPEGLAHPAHAMTFELHSAFMAYDHLHGAAPSLDAVQVDEIAQSIVLHTSSWVDGKSSATQMLLFLSASFDVFGYDALEPGSFEPLINRTTVQGVEKEYPRADFAADAVEFFSNHIDQKPNCLVPHIPGGRDALLKSIRTAPIAQEG